jgi:hypothetical protein
MDHRGNHTPRKKCREGKAKEVLKKPGDEQRRNENLPGGRRTQKPPEAAPKGHPEDDGGKKTGERGGKGEMGHVRSHGIDPIAQKVSEGSNNRPCKGAHANAREKHGKRAEAETDSLNRPNGNTNTGNAGQNDVKTHEKSQEHEFSRGQSLFVHKCSSFPVTQKNFSGSFFVFPASENRLVF